MCLFRTIVYYTNLILVEWTGAEGSMVPTILLASMSLVWVELAEIPWYSWISGSNTSANTCNSATQSTRARILKLLRSPGRNLFKGTNSASLCSLAGGCDNPITTWFLATIDCLKIQAQNKDELWETKHKRLTRKCRFLGNVKCHFLCILTLFYLVVWLLTIHVSALYFTENLYPHRCSSQSNELTMQLSKESPPPPPQKGAWPRIEPPRVKAR